MSLSSMTPRNKIYLDALEEGISRSALYQLIRSTENIEESVLVESRRMDIVGGFRSKGYIIPKGSDFYQITDYIRKTWLVPSYDWPPEKKEVLKEIQEYPRVTFDTYGDLYTYCDNLTKLTGEVPHEACPGYILCYALAKDFGYWISPSTIVAQKYTHQPRFRLLLPASAPNEIENTIAFLSQVSRRDVQIIAGATKIVQPVIDTYRSLEKVYSTQGLYDLESMAGDSSEFFLGMRSKKRKHIRKNLRDLTLVCATNISRKTWIAHSNYVITTWKNGGAGKKQMRLAITRDYIAAKAAHSFFPETSYLVYRGDLPVGLRICNRISDEVVSDLVSKAFNYSTEPGGYSNTSTTMMILVAQDLVAKGYRFLNCGTLAGGTIGLKQYKKKIIASAPGSKYIKSTNWVAPLTSFLPEISTNWKHM